ncbi:MAG TPA: hypothetical protein VHZ55_06455 [Bryobacteraceae bacterium]|jgi:hypothetical protein|nr:hypothetical protein [Bryobacteraceae bacterium]
MVPVSALRAKILQSIALLFFVAAGVLCAPLLGFEDDELIFVNIFWHPNECFSRLPLLGGHAIPIMVVSYAGALKTWLYSPLLFFADPTVWLVRLPALLLAAFTIALTGRLLSLIAGSTASAMAVCLLATDATFLLTSTFDWGPVVLQHLLLVISLLLLIDWYGNQDHRLLFFGGLAIGLALWDKSLFLWQVTGLTTAFLFVGFAALRESWNRRNLWLFARGVLLGALPLIAANFRHHFATVKDNGHASLAQLAPKAAFLRSALDGQAATAFLVDGAIASSDRTRHPFESIGLALNHVLGQAPSSWRFYPGLILILLGICIARGTQRKWILFFFVSGCVAWFQSAITRNAGNVIQHAVLFWITWYCALALSLTALFTSPVRYVRAAIVLIVSTLCVRGALGIGADYGELIAHPGTSRWTNADTALTDLLLKSGVRRVVETDWGIKNVVRARSGDRIAVDKQSAALHAGSFDGNVFNGCAASDCVVVAHAPGRYVSAPADLEQTFRRNGFSELGKTLVYDTHGVPGFELFHLGRLPSQGQTQGN